MDYNHLLTERRGDVALLTIAAPATMNALNSAILREIEDFVDHLPAGTRCLVVTGAGEKSFVAGADIAEMRDLDKEQGTAFGRLGARVFRKIEELECPVVAAVNGFALGGGCELAMACDIRLAADNAKFGQPEVGLGIIPGFSGTVRLPRLVGQGMAKDLIYTGRVIDAQEALRIGLVNAVAPRAELMDRAMALANQIAANAPAAVAAAKRSINQGYDMAADDAIALENRLFGECFATQDQKEGMAAFLEKPRRKANFAGK